MPPGADQGRQAGDVAHRHAATAHTLDAIVDADRGRFAALRGLAVQACQVDHFVDRDAAGFGSAFRRPLERARLQGFETKRVFLDVVVIEQVFLDQHVHHAQRQRRVGAWQQGDVLVALLGRQGTIGIDRDQGRTAALGLLRAHPEMQVGCDRIAAPDQDQFGVLELLEVGADRTADGIAITGGAGGGADGAIEQRGAQLVEKAQRHRFALHQAHGAAIAIRQDGLRVAFCDWLQARCDGVEGLVPADAFEFALALAAHAAHRIQHAVRVIGAVDIARHLGAQHPGRGRMLRIALHFCRHAVFDFDEDGTGVGTIVGAGRTDVGNGHILIGLR